MELHDFVITPRHAVWFCGPAILDARTRERVWTPDIGTRIVVLPRSGDLPGLRTSTVDRPHRAGAQLVPQAQPHRRASPSPQDRPLLGPYAAAALADRATREGRGESFWCVADLSGNLVEMVVTVLLAAGRAFLPRHGDGDISADGAADVDGWPRTGSGVGGFGLFGHGYRGGDFFNPETDLRTSSRNVANFGGSRRLFGLGFRAVRSASP